VTICIQFSPNNSKLQLKAFKIIFANATNDIVKTYIKNNLYHYTTPSEMVICDSEGTTGDCKF
jgi:hypothetical protein